MLDDSELIERYFSRDESAIYETSVKYGGLCFKISNNILNSREDAEECVNETYLRIWNSIPPERPENFRGFISAAVRNLSLDRFRFLSRKKRSAELEISLSELENVLPDESVSEKYSENGLSDILEEFLDTLSKDSRVIFLKRYWYFDSISEISAECGFSVSKIKKELTRARAKLRAFLSERGVRI